MFEGVASGDSCAAFNGRQSFPIYNGACEESCASIATKVNSRTSETGCLACQPVCTGTKGAFRKCKVCKGSLIFFVL